MAVNFKPEDCVDLCPPIRNRYFYGKLLDVFHFELEQKYLNHKRWLLNRLVGGYGVICGLDVRLGSDNQSVIVMPGVAIDKCGREIIVCQPTAPLSLRELHYAPVEHHASEHNPAQTSVPVPAPAPRPGPGYKTGDPCAPNLENYHLLTICFHECQTDPVPALGGDCDTQALCSPGAIRETYKLEIKPRGLCRPQTKSKIQNAISGGQVRYEALVDYIRDSCPCFGDDCCIPLANITVPDHGQTYDPNSIDIAVRPIVYTNDLLYELILAMNQPRPNDQSAK